MSQFNWMYIFLGVLLVSIVRADPESSASDLNEVIETKPFKWIKGVQDAITSPTGHVVVQVAKELLNRSAGNSQVKFRISRK